MLSRPAAFTGAIRRMLVALRQPSPFATKVIIDRLTQEIRAAFAAPRRIDFRREAVIDMTSH